MSKQRTPLDFAYPDVSTCRNIGTHLSKYQYTFVEISVRRNNSTSKQRYCPEDFNNCFGDLPNYVKTKSPLKVKFRDFATFIQKHKNYISAALKQQIRDTFSEEKWGELTREQKEAHTLKDCQVSKDLLIHLIWDCSLLFFIPDRVSLSSGVARYGVTRG